VRYQYGCRQCVVASFPCFSDLLFYCRSFLSFLLPVPFALYKVMLSRCKCMADWKLIAKCALKELQQAVAPLLLNEVSRLRGGERTTMKRDERMVRAYLAELSMIESYMTTCLAAHPQELGLSPGGKIGLATRSAADRFNNALNNIEPLRMGLEAMLSPKAEVGICDECKGLEPLRSFRQVKKRRKTPSKAGYLGGHGTRRLCGDCEHLDRTGQLYRPCGTCKLLYQPYLTHDPVEPGQLRLEPGLHEGCMQRQCRCGEGEYCPPDADAAPVVGATPTPPPSAWGTATAAATSASLSSSWRSVDVPPCPELQQEEKQPADPPSNPAAGSSCGGNAPDVDGSDAAEDEEWLGRKGIEPPPSPPRTRRQVVEEAETGLNVALSSTTSMRTRSSMYGT